MFLNILLAVNVELLNTLSIVAIVIGIVLGIIEILNPGFGIFGVLGFIFSTVGIILRIIAGGNMFVTVLIILILVIFFTLSFVLLGKSAKSGRLSKTAFVMHESALPTTRTEGTKDYSEFLGQTGVAKTTLRPVGKGEFDGKTVEVISSDNTVIDIGTKIIVTYVEGQKVLVNKVD